MSTMTIPTQIVPPNASSHTHTVVFLHGRGDNASDFLKSIQCWRDSNQRNLFETYPSFRWVFPQAPTRPVAASGGTVTFNQWFDVWNTSNFADNEDLQAVGLKEVVPAIRNLIHAEAGTLGGDYTKVILAGISMGGATSVHTLFNLAVPGEGRLGAFMGFSCRCPFAGRTLAQMRSTLQLEGSPDNNRLIEMTPMLLEHCVDDPLVLVDSGRQLGQTLHGFGAKVQWKEYPSGGHWFKSPEGVDDVVQFLNQVLRPQSNGLSQLGAMDLS